MKIVHISSIFTNGLGYQENLLAKYHKRLGLDVEVISSKWVYDPSGMLIYSDNDTSIDPDGIKITRLEIKRRMPYRYRFRRFEGFREALESARPDILFVHGCQFLDIDQIVRYLKRHPNVTVYVDNHADFSNSATNWLSQNILHKVIWRWYAHQIEPYTEKFYGVLPARVDFLTNVYGLPKEKCELLVMGADDELIEKAKRSGAGSCIRAQYNIDKDDLLVITGGKIDGYRPETLNLMQAVAEIDRKNVKLLLFGAVSNELERKFYQLCEDRHIIYAGWLRSADIYDYFTAADLVVFPGLHSVMWEQAVAQGKPCVFRNIDGFHHVDIGGNAEFIDDVSVEGLKKMLMEIIDHPQRIQMMKSIGEKKGMAAFSCMQIARKSILQ